MPSQDTPDLTSVRSLIPSVTDLARHVGVTNNSIYRWIKVNRIPGTHVIKVANFYDVEVSDLLPLTGSELSGNPGIVLKSREVLPILLKVQRREMTLDEAADALKMQKNGLKLILINWADDLPTLYGTLEGLDKGEITLDQACFALKVAKTTMHGLRRKYGYRPGLVPKVSNAKPKTLPGRRQAATQAALKVIAGLATADGAAKALGISTRNLFRHIDRLTDHKLTELSTWPKTFREALAQEIEHDWPNYAEQWLVRARSQGLFVSKVTRHPRLEANIRLEPLKRLLAAVLVGDVTLEEVAVARGGEPEVLRTLFTGDLRVLGMTFDELMGLSAAHHLAMADYLIWSLDRKRKFSEESV